ncbi:MAG TPA: methyltransferase domain-containing protein, partial [Halobacteriales archaeon]|nr:methyltransferase domain-containing protein [Halobacteriales archaeon]
MSDRAERPSKGLDELRDIYADDASTYDRFEFVDRLTIGRYRERLFSRAAGRILDVACGTGVNFPYLPEGADLVGVDLSPEMAARARARA